MNLHNLRIILVRPKHSANVGAAARAMRNCGVRDLHLVNPAPLDRNLADALAVHATDVLETMQTHTSLRAAVGPCGMVVGTTCRTGLYREDAKPLEARVPEIAARLATNRVALVFGPEDTGLTNRDLACCSTLLTIPTDPACASLNLAQAVLLCCYAVYRAASEPASASPTVLATAERQELMYEKLRAALLRVDFPSARQPGPRHAGPAAAVRAGRAGRPRRPYSVGHRSSDRLVRRAGLAIRAAGDGGCAVTPRG